VEPTTASAGSVRAARQEAHLRAISAVREAFADAIRRHDAATIASLYSEAATIVAPEAVLLRGRRDAARFWGAGIDSGMTDVELEPDDIGLLDGTAWEVGRYVVRFETGEPDDGGERLDDGELVDRGRYLLVYRLDGDGWSRVAEMLAPDRPVPHAAGGP
jgi:ketosteroid isomerase-like protein